MIARYSEPGSWLRYGSHRTAPVLTASRHELLTALPYAQSTGRVAYQTRPYDEPRRSDLARAGFFVAGAKRLNV